MFLTMKYALLATKPEHFLKPPKHFEKLGNFSEDQNDRVNEE